MATETKPITHTKGEWEQHQHAPFSVWAGERQIAACRFLLDDGQWDPNFPQTSDECVANARLIAAAPDLYEAAKELLSIVGNRLPIDRFAEAKSKALAAIAKAEGSR